MEGLADAVGMSKATVYGYFKDKDAVFTAVADRMADRLYHAVDAALAREGSLGARIAAALNAKQRLVFERVRRSPFAKELFAAKDLISAERYEALDRAIEALIVKALVGAGWSAKLAESRARLLLAAVQGIGEYTADLATVEADIAVLVDAVIAAGKE
jgi:AcrR family transcriptional regulator